MAFKEIYSEFSDRIYFISKRYNLPEEMANDMVQDVFMKIWEKREDINPDLSIGSFILTIARNMIINKVKRQALEIANLNYSRKFKNDFVSTTEDFIIFRDYEKHATEFIETLPEKKRQIFLLSRSNGLSNKEIAEELGISQRTVENNIYQAEKAIKGFLREHNMM